MTFSLQEIWADPNMRAGIIVVGAVAAGFLFDRLVARVLLLLAGKTETDVDDKIIEVLHKPIFWSVFMGGAAWAIFELKLPRPVPYIVNGLIKTAAVFIWISAFSKIGTIFLQWLAQKQDQYRVVQPRTLPLFDIAVKIVVIGGGIYALMLSWNINVTGWLASAGILGLAIGFAAKDTLANLFAGVFILADAPYKLGDYIVIATGERGKVVEIGMRSTRVLTRDDIEIVVPNSAIANGKIINESGPVYKRRIRISVGVSYSSDPDLVEKVLLQVAEESQEIAKTPEPRVRFRTFGDSSLDYQLLVWIDEPEWHGRITHELNTAVLKAFRAAGIEIPFPQRDVHMIPASPGDTPKPAKT
ncbi:MAG: mechanosensitive ion channel family protein [bacterium]